MICDICQTAGVIATVEIAGTKYNLCEYDLIFADRMIHSRKHHCMLNIAWGAGRIGPQDWYGLRDFFRANNIKEVLEMGAGLSSELFVNEGLDLISFDVLKEHVFLLQTLDSMKNYATFHHYEYGVEPPVGELYPGRKWDFVFVDGPQERSREVKVAMEVSSKYIFLHDPNFGEQSFFPNEEWIKVENSDKLFEKVQKCF